LCRIEKVTSQGCPAEPFSICHRPYFVFLFADGWQKPFIQYIYAFNNGRMLKKNLSNPSLLFLVAGNLFCIWYFQTHPEGFATVVWIYWFQSVIIGLFNFLFLLTVKNFDTGNFTMNNKPVKPESKGCMAWFFLVHYGFFHLGYAIFLLVGIGVKSLDSKLLLIGVVAFFLESILNFIRQKQMERRVSFQLNAMFFLPYLRIVPMHLMILLPAFLGWKPSLIFLVLKMAADFLSFIFLQKQYEGSGAKGV
jgi:Family of unknown function (DUF6498)